MGKFPDTLKRLVDRFAQQADTILRPDYNETLIRIDFINPLMRELGWDIDNTQGFAEQYREVVHEDRVKVAGQTKAPDYSFRVGGTRKFFLEAKKPSVDIRNNVEPAYQLRRYAWSAKLACSLLTDFEEFAIYDTRIRPVHLEKASVGRREYIVYTDYEARWDFLDGTFSKNAVLLGEFDRYCESKKGRDASQFDEAFLTEIEGWRKAIASSIARNNEIDEPSLNFSVQRIIDRIIFLRIAEDRGTETVGQLQALLGGEKVYDRLRKLFRDADARYNSGLFHFAKEKDRDEAFDTLTPTLEVDDKTLKGIIRALYYPQSPYEFTVVSADILGSVYERFLGKVITLTAGHNAKIVEKPEVRKAGGVYYTPKYIVDYIVANTVGKLLEGKSPKEAAKIKVLDPACGSGSFLIGAYQHLLDWYLKQYLAADPAALAALKNPVVRPAFARAAQEADVAAGDHVVQGWALTIAERKRILLNHVHGVDLDGQAVEVTKLNLLLKCLEGETSATLGFEQRLFRERALPDLGKNILCGNSLIGTDIMATEAWKGMSDEEKARMNPFDYERAFAAIFKQGKFDAVIGNPPYVRMEAFAPIKDYLAEHYDAHDERADLYAYILEKGIRVVSRGGFVGQIVSNKFIRAKYGKALRRFIRAKTHVDCIADFAGADVFHGATVRTVVLLLSPRIGDGAATPSTYVPVPDPATIATFEARAATVEQHAATHSFTLATDAFEADEWRIASAGQSALLDKLRSEPTTLKVAIGGKASFGFKTGCNEAFIVERSDADSIDPARLITKPVLLGREIRRYNVEPTGKRVIYLHANAALDSAPEVRRHLTRFKQLLEERAGPQEWFELQQPAVGLLKYEKQPKIIFPIIANECRFTLDRDGFLVNDKAFMLPTADLRVLGVLNSRIANFYFGLVCAALEGENERYLEFRAQYVDYFPLRASVMEGNEALAALVDAMLALHKRLAAEQLPQRKEQIQREIDATDRQIDQLVYALYGLTDEEVAIVEAATA